MANDPEDQRGPPPRPPRFARRLLEWAAPRSERWVVLGELDELFHQQLGAYGKSRASWWYRRQGVGFVIRARTARRWTDNQRNREGMMSWIGDVRSDVRSAFRSMKKRPMFTGVAVATLALGVGANSAIFTLANAHFLSPMPYTQPDQVVLLWETNRNSDEVTTVAPGNYLAWRDEASSFTDIAAYNVATATLSGDQDAEQVTAANVVPHFFDVLGVRPTMGPGFTEGAARTSDGRLAILSDGLWRRRYGSDPDVVGSDIRVNGEPHTVVGVLPADYRQPEKSLRWQGAEIWTVDLLDGQQDNYGNRWLRTVARLAPGVSVEQARIEMEAIGARLAEAYPGANAGRSIQVWTLDDYLLGDGRPILIMLLIAGAAVLLIVCANVANLTLARGQERRQEFAVRAALGSGTTRLLRQVVVESVVLALAGAAVAALVLMVGQDLLQAAQERFFSSLVPASIDLRVLVGTTLVALAAGLLFGLPLALSASATDLRGALIEGGARAGRRSGVTQNLLIVGQVGMATTLLVVAMLLTRSFGAMLRVPTGFEPSGVVTFTVSASSATYPETEQVEAYLREVWREMEAVPGVLDVGMATDLPFTLENRYASISVQGHEYDPENPPMSDYKMVFPEYFQVMGIPILAGAPDPDGWATPEAEYPLVINQHTADLYWPGEDPIGKTINLEWGPARPMRVVAVAGNVLDDGFEGTPEPILYIPWGAVPQRRMAVVLRTASTGPEIYSAVRAALGRVDPDVPAADLRMLDELMAETIVRPKAASLIGGLFAAIALLVAAAGIFGVVSFLVQSRTREIGIRAVLGARSEQILSLVIGQSSRLVMIGLVLGVMGALLAGRALSGVLFGISVWDPISLIGATLLLGAVATFAAWVPAQRAVRVDPTEALRAE